MSTHNVCFHGEIRKMPALFEKKYLNWSYDKGINFLSRIRAFDEQYIQLIVCSGNNCHKIFLRKFKSNPIALKMLTTKIDGILIFFFFFFGENNLSFKFSCKLSYLFWKILKKIRMSSATILLSALRINFVFVKKYTKNSSILLSQN